MRIFFENIHCLKLLLSPEYVDHLFICYGAVAIIMLRLHDVFYSFYNTLLTYSIIRQSIIFREQIVLSNWYVVVPYKNRDLEFEGLIDIVNGGFVPGRADALRTKSKH